jgi:putative membrane protein
MVSLTSDERAEIAEAIAHAELTTRGEIVCVVAPSSSDYEEVPLAYAALAALLIPLILVAISLVQPHWHAAQVASFRPSGLELVVLLQGLVFAVVWFVLRVRILRRALTPSPLKRQRVKRRAMEQFLARDLSSTTGRTGVLIYVSLEERMVELLADHGVSESVPEGSWTKPMALLVAALKRGALKDGLKAVVRATGAILAFAAPIGDSNIDVDELPNDVVELPPG